MKKAKKKNSGPINEVRIGSIKAAIWENETDNGTRYNVTFSRLYKQEGKKWNSSDSFGFGDLLLLSKVANAAHSYVYDEMLSSGD